MNILHKLGLYRKSEVEELITKAAALTESVDGVIEEAKEDRTRFDTAIKMLTDVEIAAKILKGYCAGTDCRKCNFGKSGECVFKDDVPMWWRV